MGNGEHTRIKGGNKESDLCDKLDTRGVAKDLFRLPAADTYAHRTSNTTVAFIKRTVLFLPRREATDR